jgi:hypothetical protein
MLPIPCGGLTHASRARSIPAPDASASPQIQYFQSGGSRTDHCLLLIFCGTDAGMTAVSCGNPQSAVGVGGRLLRITDSGVPIGSIAFEGRRMRPGLVGIMATIPTMPARVPGNSRNRFNGSAAFFQSPKSCGWSSTQVSGSTRCRSIGTPHRAQCWVMSGLSHLPP